MTDVLDRIGEQLVAAEHGLHSAATSSAMGRASRRRRLLSRGRRPLVVFAVLVGVSGSAGGLALAGTFSGTTESPQAWVSGQRVQPEPAIPPEQSVNLGILRRPRVASDALSPAQASDYDNTPEAASGPNTSLSRRAEGLTAGAAWLIPGNGSICFEAHYPVAGGGSTCGDDASFDTGREMIFGFNDLAPGLLGVAGVVPDGVSTVNVTPADGPPQTLTVHENVYLAEIKLGGFTVSFNGPQGPVTIPAASPVPAIATPIGSSTSGITSDNRTTPTN